MIDLDKTEIEPCPFCGRRSELAHPDTLYPTGTGWKPHHGIRAYVSFREVPKEQWCYGMHCDTSCGGCGAEIQGDSIEEAIAAWNRRPAEANKTAPDDFDPRDMDLIKMALLLMSTNYDHDGVTRNRAHAMYQVLQQERTLPALARPPADPDATRFRFLLTDPETARHLLLLLLKERGKVDDFRRMIDRIVESKAVHAAKQS